MTHPISSLKISNQSYTFKTNENNSTNWLNNLSKFNIFVASNNSGKSRFIRSILTNRIEFIPQTFKLEVINGLCSDFKNKVFSYFGSRALDPESIHGIIDSIPTLTTLIEGDDEHAKAIENVGIILERINSKNNYRIGTRSYPEIYKTLQPYYKELVENPFFVKKGKLLSNPIKRLYIPMLRGLRNPDTEQNDIYKIKTNLDYFPDINSDFVATGLSFYKDIRSLLLGNLADRAIIRSYENFLSRNFFDNQQIALIPKDIDNTLTIKIGKEAEQKIDQLGDGLQSIILCTFPLFKYKNENLLVFIEEPEQWLHPSFQRKLVQTLIKEKGFEGFQYFVTTHSNHLLDISLDIDYRDFVNIYTIKKQLDSSEIDEEVKPKFQITTVKHGQFDILSDLGIRNTSVYLSNCTIWVEGITDRYYIKHYLNLYEKAFPEKKVYSEDTNYSFVEYSGSNISHWFSISNTASIINPKYLCGKLFLIADLDENKEAKHKKLKRILGARYYSLPRREIENLLSVETIKSILVANGEDNNKINSFTENDYKFELLGKFIETKILKKRKRKYAADSGTILNKINFCEKAIDKIQKWEDMTDDAQKLTKKIYKFIDDNQQE